jgi:hypothetical protein
MPILMDDQMIVAVSELVVVLVGIIAPFSGPTGVPPWMITIIDPFRAAGTGGFPFTASPALQDRAVTRYDQLFKILQKTSLNGRNHTCPDEDVLENFAKVLDTRLIGMIEQLSGQPLGLGLSTIAVLLFGLLFIREISEMPHSVALTSSDLMGTGFVPWAIEDSIHEIIVGPHAWSIHGGKTGEDREKLYVACFVDPGGDALHLPYGHKNKGAKHRDRVSWGSAVIGRVYLLENGNDRVEIEMCQDDELLEVTFKQ